MFKVSKGIKKGANSAPIKIWLYLLIHCYGKSYTFPTLQLDFGQRYLEKMKYIHRIFDRNLNLADGINELNCISVYIQHVMLNPPSLSSIAFH